MPLPTDNAFIAEKNKPANQPIYLYTIFQYDGVGDLNFAEYDTDVVYNGITYQKFPISHEHIGENTQGEIEAVRVRIANVSRVIQTYLENYNFRNKKVRIRLVWANRLDDTDAYVDFIYYIDSYVADEKVAEFILMPKLDVLDVSLPARVYSRNYCGWKFKSTECGYTGGQIFCNKTRQRCKMLNNYLRFGGFPSIPTRQIFI